MSEEAGLADTGFGLGVAVGDYDNDGDPDLFVTNYGPNVMYRNDGGGTFTEVTAEAEAQAASCLACGLEGIEDVSALLG